MSIKRPKKNANKSNDQLEVSKGNIIIKRT